MQVIGAVQRSLPDDAIVVCAAGGLPGELHKLWKAGAAERLPPGIRLLDHGLRDRRRPRRQDGPPRPRGRGDGRRRQLHDAELRARHLASCSARSSSWCCSTTAATAASTACRSRPAARASTTCSTPPATWCPRAIDFAAHAAAMGATAEKVGSIAELEAALGRARASDRSYVVVIDTDPLRDHRGRRPLVGRGGARGLRPAPRCRRPAGPTRRSANCSGWRTDP